ncbi:hypothetical protein R3P38DRAFT_2414322, partial [Favolaschia claudopus]
DGQLAIILSNLIYLYYLQEVKNELGSTSVEPNIEITRYYIEQCRRCHNAGATQRCNFPTVFLCQSAVHTASAVFTDVPIVEQLACIPLHAHSTNMAQVEAGARVIGALRVAPLDLLNRYPTLVNELQCDFPFPRSYEEEDTAIPFAYTAALDGKRVFRAAL